MLSHLSPDKQNQARRIAEQITAFLKKQDQYREEAATTGNSMLLNKAAQVESNLVGLKRSFQNITGIPFEKYAQESGPTQGQIVYAGVAIAGIVGFLLYKGMKK